MYLFYDVMFNSVMKRLVYNLVYFVGMVYSSSFMCSELNYMIKYNKFDINKLLKSVKFH